MTETTPITLSIWKGDYGVASVDPQCLTALTIFKFQNMDVNVEYARYPEVNPLPQLSYDTKTVNGSNVLVDAAKLSEADLSISRQSELLAYKYYFSQCFEPAFFFDCWINEINHNYAIKSWYYKVIAFPYNYIYIKRQQSLARERYLTFFGPSNLDEKLAEYYAGAGLCLKDLAGLLNDNRTYLFGEYPSSLDAQVYSYFMIASRMPSPDPRIQNLIKDHQVIMRYLRRITLKYYPNLNDSYKYVQPINTMDSTSVTTVAFAAIVAGTAMVYYAYNVGILNTNMILGGLGNMRFIKSN